MKNHTGHIAIEGSAPYTPNGNPRRFVKILTTDGRLADVITYDYGNVSYILRAAGVPVVNESGTVTASEYRDLEGWRDRIASGDPEWSPTAVRSIATSPNGAGPSYAVRFPSGKVARPDVPAYRTPVKGGRFVPLADQ